MELRHIRYFLAVAETKSFRRAAETVFISQPGLSQQIQQLEEELGQSLFDRSGKKVALTPAGLLFREHAVRVVHEIEEARVALRELQDLRRGSLHIGVVQTVNTYLMPEWVMAFCEKFPGVTLHVEEMSSDEIEEGILAGRLQLGVAFLPFVRDGLVGEELFHEDLVLIVPESHRFAREQTVSLGRLAGEPLLLLSKAHCTRRLLDRMLAAAQILPPKVSVEMTSIAGLLATVRSTGVPTVLPRLALNGSSDLVSVTLTDPTPTRSVGLLWRRDAFRCVASRAFATLAMEIAHSQFAVPVKPGKEA